MQLIIIKVLKDFNAENLLKQRLWYLFLVGEDGQIKIWSKSGMLRSTLVQQGKLLFLYCFWNST